MRPLIAFLAALALPAVAFAHEVYVLSPEVVFNAMQSPPLAVIDIILQHTGQFFFWAFITAWAILTVLSISVSKRAERLLTPILTPLKRYAPFVARITLGSAMMMSAYEGAMFGPELPMSAFVPLTAIPLAKFLLFTAGLAITIGFLTRLFALGLILAYLWMWIPYGWYMLTYINYFGEMLIALIVGNAALAFDSLLHHLYPHTIHRIVRWGEQHAFLILRVTFGISLIFASFYAKYLHAELAIMTVTEYGLTAYFPFDPPFLVLGAFAIELLLGVFILFGVEIRFGSLFLLFWLTLSLLYFKEAVWPHIILAGGALAIFMHGYDRYTVEWGLMHRGGRRAREPVL